MKKVLILSAHNPYKTHRGSEKYCIEIIETFKNKIDFHLKLTIMVNLIIMLLECSIK